MKWKTCSAIEGL